MNKGFYISIYTSFFIIIAFSVVKIMLLFGFVNNSNAISWYEFVSVLIFLVPFYFIIKENIDIIHN